MVVMKKAFFLELCIGPQTNDALGRAAWQRRIWVTNLKSFGQGVFFKH
jgi:hypothetical protein